MHGALLSSHNIKLTCNADVSHRPLTISKYVMFHVFKTLLCVPHKATFKQNMLLLLFVLVTRFPY